MHGFFGLVKKYKNKKMRLHGFFGSVKKKYKNKKMRLHGFFGLVKKYKIKRWDSLNSPFSKRKIIKYLNFTMGLRTEWKTGFLSIWPLTNSQDMSAFSLYNVYASSFFLLFFYFPEVLRSIFSYKKVAIWNINILTFPFFSRTVS